MLQGLSLDGFALERFAARVTLQDVKQVDTGGVLDHLDGLQHVVVDLTG